VSPARMGKWSTLVRVWVTGDTLSFIKKDENFTWLSHTVEMRCPASSHADARELSVAL